MPKIFPDDVPKRTAVRDTQLAEQLVEVPTIVSLSSLQRNVEQKNVAIPVPGGGVRLPSLQGFLPGQSSTAPTVSQIVDNPAPSGEVFKVFVQDRVDPHVNEPGEGFFRTFLRVKISPKSAASPSPRCPPVAAHSRRALIKWLVLEMLFKAPEVLKAFSLDRA